MRDLKVMSFNVKVKDITENRLGGVVDIIKRYSPDLLGIQEANGFWMDYLTANLTDEYSYTFLGREDSIASEGTPVFFRKSRFNLVAAGTKWLSITPSVCSKTEGAKKLRVLTYTDLRDRETDRRIIFISTHLDHSGDEIALVQAGYFMNITEELFGDDAPIITVGDFNVRPDSKTVAYFTAECGYTSASNSPEIKDDTFTFGENRIIDYILYRHSDAAPVDYKVIKDRYNGDLPSDHYPIMATFKML